MINKKFVKLEVIIELDTEGQNIPENRELFNERYYAFTSSDWLDCVGAEGLSEALEDLPHNGYEFRASFVDDKTEVLELPDLTAKIREYISDSEKIDAEADIDTYSQQYEDGYKDAMGCVLRLILS